MSASKTRACYLHIGPHKTGSSSIQQFVRENEMALAARGLRFPVIVKENGKLARNHRLLAAPDELTEDGDIRPGAKLWPQVDAVARAGEADILLSHESFVTALPGLGSLDRIVKYFGKRGYAVTVIAYVRDQPGWLNSWYVQNQKRLNGEQSFDGFVEEFAASGRVEPGRYLAPFFEDPRIAVDVVSFERAISAGLEADFLRRCGVEDIDGLVATPIRNVNAGAKTVYAGQQIMKRLGRPLRNYDCYGRIYREFKASFQEFGWESRPYVALDQHLYETIRSRYAPTNDAFAREHFGAAWEELVPARTYERSVLDPTAATPGEMEQIEAVVERALATFAKKAGKAGKRTAD
ncbi:hypothetical protein [Methylopila sp. M107]|uniref:hypothetical protein n=1 Tax=Methylopila sp. M107 TaxID=1101190 RepID=UPI00035DAB68|nr:hypothetical protein [Methylopila sp. M107]